MSVGAKKKGRQGGVEGREQDAPDGHYIGSIVIMGMDIRRDTHLRAHTYLASFVPITSPAEDVLKDRRETWKLEILYCSVVWMPKRHTHQHTNLDRGVEGIRR
jgi:hypothetical protein